MFLYAGSENPELERNLSYMTKKSSIGFIAEAMNTICNTTLVTKCADIVKNKLKYLLSISDLCYHRKYQQVKSLLKNL